MSTHNIFINKKCIYMDSAMIKSNSLQSECTDSCVSQH